MIPLVAASEKGKGQTESFYESKTRCGKEQGLSQWIKVFWKGIP